MDFFYTRKTPLVVRNRRILWWRCDCDVNWLLIARCYYYLRLNEKPCLWVKGAFEDHHRRMYNANIIEKIAEKLVRMICFIYLGLTVIHKKEASDFCHNCTRYWPFTNLIRRHNTIQKNTCRLLSGIWGADSCWAGRSGCVAGGYRGKVSFLYLRGIAECAS